MAEYDIDYDKWKLYAGGQTLGTEDQFQNLSTQYESELISGKAPWGEGTIDVADVTRGQLDTYQRYQRDRAYVDKGSYDKNQAEYRRIEALYGVPKNTSGASAFRDKSVGELYGYSAAGQGTVEKYYGEKYGTAEGFTEGAELESAWDRVYGEVQEAPDMGEGWKGLYQQYGKWQREDELWFEEAQKVQGLEEGAKGEQRARMAAGGMQAGSKQWQTSMSRIDEMRVNLDQAKADKAEALKGTSVYQALEDEYKERYRSPELRVKGESVTEYRPVLEKEGYIRPAYTTSVQRYNSETGSVYFEDVKHEAEWVDPTYSQEEYQSYQETPTETGKLMYGAGDEGTTAPTFDEYYTQNFGVQDYSDVTSVYSGLSTDIGETDEEANARRAASGQAF